MFFYLQTRRQTSSTAPDLSKNEFKKEKERLTTELHFITQKRNEQRDHLIAFKEGSMNKRYALLQTLLCQSGVFNVSLILSFEGGGFYEALPPDPPYAQLHIHKMLLSGEAEPEAWSGGR